MIEAIVEELEPKRELFAELDRIDAARRDPRDEHVGALRDGDRGGDAEHPERVVGMHFFNPAPVLPLVEIVRARGSSDEAVRRRVRLGRSRPASGRSAATTRPASSSTAS